ncbi:MAG: RNA 3'-terminal phosphate cyclase [Myxococcales bacterium]|nr:RNA 3'-terminal phosphate cyclase [Myxococcales bacterium]
MLRIDGAQGEGGGQVLRSSLALAGLTGRPVELSRIRAGRQKSGLLRQHLTAVRAAAEVTGATVEGAELRSAWLRFTPGPIRGGTYHLAVGTAGSATLVCQTVLPLLLAADGPSTLVFEGGTHNPAAPPYDFLEAVYFPLLRRMGAQVEARMERAGFYPAGGGRFVLEVAPGRPGPVPPLARAGAPVFEAWAMSAGLAVTVAKRELAVVRDALGISREAATIRRVEAPGRGNVVHIRVTDGDAVELVTAFGAVGRPAEVVAAEAVEEALRFVDLGAPVGEHLADMLVLLVGLYGGAFETGVWSLHASTNLAIVQAFLGADAVQAEERGGRWYVARP